MAFLKVTSGPSKGKDFKVDRDEVVIGRSHDNAVPLGDPSVSGRHCVIERSGRKYVLRDLDSTNGTLLNNVRITEYRLSPKDVIRVGANEMIFDGSDIEPPGDDSSLDETQVTVKLPSESVSSQTPSPRFAAPKDSRMKWVIILAVLGVVTLAALAWFLVRLFGSWPLTD
ncbi:MAG: FHA domain-containing protein [Kiritimatiellia bacterium]